MSVDHDVVSRNGETFEHVDGWGTCLCSCRLCRDRDGLCICPECVECTGGEQ